MLGCVVSRAERIVDEVGGCADIHKDTHSTTRILESETRILESEDKMGLVRLEGAIELPAHCFVAVAGVGVDHMTGYRNFL